MLHNNMRNMQRYKNHHNKMQKILGAIMKTVDAMATRRPRCVRAHTYPLCSTESVKFILHFAQRIILRYFQTKRIGRKSDALVI
jgi:hypothetical protein